jgi:transcriptional regulator
MQSFEQALLGFIKHTNTPMTVAIQGEWGSGKTSLMNRLSERLCETEDANFYSIWLNTWHYSLTDNPQNTLADIIQTLINEVLEVSRKEHPQKLKNLIKDVSDVSKNVFKGLSQVALKTAIPNLSDDAVNDLDKAVFNKKDEKRYNLNDLRNKLSSLITATVEKNIEKKILKETFVFFIDDLDRIEPAVAVKILEMLKNIFDIEHCIFVLAIDFDVVVSGLKPKFGELNESNEREFRSFFDKIIQLPFRMPVQSFVIDDFLKESLLSIDVISKEESLQDDFIKTLAEFARSSLGSNPRSLKRLANSLSFINLLMNVKQNQPGRKREISSIEKQISFAVVCLQIAFPSIYNLLADHPDFQNWNEEFAQNHRAERTSITDPSGLLQYDMFAHEWQKIIYASCHKSSYLSKHTYNIIRMLERIKQIATDQDLLVGDLIADVFEFSAITNVKEESKPKFEFNPVRVYFTINNKLLPILQNKLPQQFESVDRVGRIIAKINYGFVSNGKANKVMVQLPLRHNRLAVKVGFSIPLFGSDGLNENPIENIESLGKTEYLRQLTSKLIDLDEKYPSLHKLTPAGAGLFIKKDKLMFENYFQTYVDSIDYIYTNKFIETLSDFIIELAIISFQFTETEWN